MDDDDLDELLDEVERTFCRKADAADSNDKTTKCAGDGDGRREPSASNSHPALSSLAEDIDALLEELQEEDDPPHPQAAESPRRALERRPLEATGRRCCPVFLGGSAITNGVGTASSKRSCDQLRCMSCDFQVLMFDDYEWDPTCDYLFLRNNMPDRQKLRAKLRRRHGIRAYACQCSWYSATDATDLRDAPRLRWVCGKHRN